MTQSQFRDFSEKFIARLKAHCFKNHEEIDPNAIKLIQVSPTQIDIAISKNISFGSQKEYRDTVNQILKEITNSNKGDK